MEIKRQSTWRWISSPGTKITFNTLFTEYSAENKDKGGEFLSQVPKLHSAVFTDNSALKLLIIEVYFFSRYQFQP